MYSEIKCQYPGFVGEPNIYVEDALSSSWGAQREKYQKLCEQELKNLTGRKYALMLSQGTAALITSLKSLDLPPKTPVGVPAYSWISCASSIIHAGYSPVFLDIDEDSCVVGSKAIAQIRTENLRHVMIVNMLGKQVASELLAFCADNNIQIIEDATHSLDWDNSYQQTKSETSAGKVGICSCFSFQATKTVTGGQGGALVTDCPDIYAKALSLSRHGMNFKPNGRFYWSTELGDNFPISDFQCAIIYSQLLVLKEITKRRKRILQGYLDAYRNIRSDLFHLFPVFDSHDAVYLPLIRFNRIVDCSNGFVESLVSLGSRQEWAFEMRPSSYPLHKMPTFKPYARDQDLSNSEDLAASSFILPFGNKFPEGLQHAVLQRTVEMIRFILEQ